MLIFLLSLNGCFFKALVNTGANYDCPQELLEDMKARLECKNLEVKNGG